MLTAMALILEFQRCLLGLKEVVFSVKYLQAVYRYSIES